MKQQLLFLSRILIIIVISFVLMRGVLLLSNLGYFSSLSLHKILLAFAHGVRIDLSIMLSLLFIPFLLIILPIRFFNNQAWHKVTAWFDNTIFIITVDHTNPSYLSKQSKFKGLFHISLIIYSPNPSLIQPKKVNQVRSQLDLMPTLIDLMGLEQPFSAVGSSLFSQKKYPVINNMKYLMGSINEKGYIKTDLTKVVESDLSDNDTSNSLKQLLMVNQRITKNLQANNWIH